MDCCCCFSPPSNICNFWWRKNQFFPTLTGPSGSSLKSSGQQGTHKRDVVLETAYGGEQPLYHMPHVIPFLFGSLQHQTSQQLPIGKCPSARWPPFFGWTKLGFPVWGLGVCVISRSEFYWEEPELLSQRRPMLQDCPHRWTATGYKTTVKHAEKKGC